MDGLILILLLAAIWIALVLLWHAAVAPWLRRGPEGKALTGLIWMVVRGQTRLVHHPTVRGAWLLRRRQHPGGLIIVSNHTGAVDPFLIQAACRFKIRWMMASDLMYPGLDPLWNYMSVIPVARDGSDAAPAREAIRHVREGGVVGIFPEGRIVDPPRRIWPFQSGVGLIVARTRAPVLLVWVSQTSRGSVARSLWTPSRARLEFLDLLHYDGGQRAAEITADLRRRLHEASGWPLEDDPPPVEARSGPRLELG